MHRTLGIWLTSITVFLFFSTAFFFTPPVAGQNQPPIIVRTRSGFVQGEITGQLRSFRGIPYAAPPVGDLRWRPPARTPRWDGIRDATTFAPMCIQIDANGNLVGSEDCLTLNVFTSSTEKSHNQPVMVFFHGGGNKRGSSQQPWFDHPQLVNQGVIVVTAEYRLGVLGFFAHPLLTAEGNGSSSNYGLMDQIAALAWVQDNIRAFGGDPNRVMVFGQSAGSYDIQALLASPAARGLFSRAAMESGSIPRGQSLSLADGEAASAPFVPRVGCDHAQDVLGCLRAVAADVVVQNQDGIPFVITIEPRVLPKDSFDVLEQNGSPVPLLIGSTREEAAAPPKPLDAAAYEARIHLEFDPFGPGTGDQVLALYPVMDYDTPWYALVGVASDFNVTCEVRSTALAAAVGHEQPVWRYLFTHRFQNDPGLNELRAFHIAELFFVFGNLHNILSVPYEPTTAEIELSNRMMRYWTQFAKYGNPNGLGPVEWRRYPGDAETMLELDTPPRQISGYHVPQCNYLATLPQP